MEFPLTQEQAEAQEEIDALNDSLQRMDIAIEELKRRQKEVKTQRLLKIIEKHGLEDILDREHLIIKKGDKTIKIPLDNVLLEKEETLIQVMEYGEYTKNITDIVDESLINNLIYVLTQYFGFINNQRYGTVYGTEDTLYGYIESLDSEYKYYTNNINYILKKY